MQSRAQHNARVGLSDAKTDRGMQGEFQRICVFQVKVLPFSSNNRASEVHLLWQAVEISLSLILSLSLSPSPHLAIALSLLLSHYLSLSLPTSLSL